MPFRPRAEKTRPVTAAHALGMAHRARAGSVGQTRVEAWSRHIAHRDDREALYIVFHVHSSQDFLVRDIACFDSGVVHRATLLLTDSPVGRGDMHREECIRQRNSHALSF